MITNKDQPHRTRQNVAALALLAAIVLAGTLLFSNFMRSVAVMRCVTSGRQDCVEALLTAPRQ